MIHSPPKMAVALKMAKSSALKPTLLPAGGLQAPVAQSRPQRIQGTWGPPREDDYAWLRDDARTNPDVLTYLAEASQRSMRPCTEHYYHMHLLC